MPVVSIITATRNRPDVLARALESIAQQTLTDYELLVVDDGSPESIHDQYCQLLKPFAGRARVLRRNPLLDKTGTPAIARNRGIREAQSRWVAFLDDDDRWTDPRHLEIAVSCLERTQSDVFFANRRGERQGSVEVLDRYPDSPRLVRGPCVHDDPSVFQVDLQAMVTALRHDSIHPDVVVISRQLLMDTGGFCERLIYTEDYELMMQVADRAQSVLYRPDVVAAYTVNSEGAHSLGVRHLDQLLDRLTAAQHVRATCRSAAVRRCARQRESWVLREVSELIGKRRRTESVRLRWQAFAVYPSPGAFSSLMRALVTI